MPDHKRQHYVPRTYLRNFAPDTGQRTIGIGYISGQKIIESGSLRDQCYHDYYYGDDGKIEEALSKLEARAATIISSFVQDPDYFPTRAEREILYLFVATLRGRTEAGELRVAAFREGVADHMKKLFGEKAGAAAFEEFKGSRDVVESLRAHARSSPMLYDLRLTCLTAPDGIEFLTSDAPVVMLNMFAPTWRTAPAFGVGSAGLILVLPISPKHCLLAHDDGIYALQGPKAGRLTLHRHRDVVSINAAVANSALQAIYFQDERSTRSNVPRLLNELKDTRKNLAVRFELFVKTEPGRYRLTSFDAEEGKKGDYLVQHYFPGARDRIQISGFSQRVKPRFVDTGTGAGIVRDLAWFRIASEYGDLSPREAAAKEARSFALGHPLIGSVGNWKEWLQEP